MHTRVVVGAVIIHVIDSAGMGPCVVGGGEGFDNRVEFTTYGY
jgi:hypothetical protein